VVGNPRAGFTNFTIDVYQASLSCNTCHTLTEGTDRSITPAAALRESQSFKVPHLRNVYQKLNLNRTPGASSIGGFGFLHDGTFADICTFLSQPVFGLFQNNATIKNNLNAFLQCFDAGMAPAVGYTRTVTAANVSSPSLSNDWTLLENQAATTNIALVGKGTLDGQLRGLLYQPASNTYQPDTTNFAPLTRAQLIAEVQAGGTLSLMGVPPGSGSRMGIDRDLDGVPDADVPPPTLGWAETAGEVLISWPLGAVGFRLESTDALPCSLGNRNQRRRDYRGSECRRGHALCGPSLLPPQVPVIGW
jgi:hypothetical protein